MAIIHAKSGDTAGGCQDLLGLLPEGANRLPRSGRLQRAPRRRVRLFGRIGVLHDKRHESAKTITIGNAAVARLAQRDEVHGHVEIVRVGIELVEQVGQVGGRSGSAGTQIGLHVRVIAEVACDQPRWCQPREPRRTGQHTPIDQVVAILAGAEMVHRLVHGSRQVELGTVARYPVREELLVSDGPVDGEALRRQSLELAQSLSLAAPAPVLYSAGRCHHTGRHYDPEKDPSSP